MKNLLVLIHSLSISVCLSYLRHQSHLTVSGVPVGLLEQVRQEAGYPQQEARQVEGGTLVQTVVHEVNPVGYKRRADAKGYRRYEYFFFSLSVKDIFIKPDGGEGKKNKEDNGLYLHGES